MAKSRSSTRLTANRWLGASLPLVALAVGSCGKTAPSPASGPASVSAASADAATAESPPARPPPRAAPPDLDLVQLRKTLACPATTGKPSAVGGKHACAVIAEFEQAGRWTSNRPSGEERWFGHAYVIDKGAEREEYVALVSRTVPTARVGPDDLPFMLSYATLPTEFQYDAGKLWSSMTHGIRHRGNKKSPANRYVETFTPTGERGVANTAGVSAVLITELSEDQAYLRRASMKRLLWLRPAKGASADQGDGTYAEFWQATW